MLPETPPDGFPEIDHFPVKPLPEVVYPVWETNPMMGLGRPIRNVIYITGKPFDPSVHRAALPSWRRRGPAYWLWRAWTRRMPSPRFWLWCSRAALVLFALSGGLAAWAAITGQAAQLDGALAAAGINLLIHEAYHYLYRRSRRHQRGGVCR